MVTPDARHKRVRHTRKREWIMRALNDFAKCEAGATAIEYGLIAALIGVAIITVTNNVGLELQGTFNDIQTGMQKRPKV